MEFFDENNIQGYDYIVSSEIQSVENYNTAFILLGVYPNNYVIQDNQSDSFINLLNNGGNIYMEGADTWAFDSQTSLHDYFGLAGEADGSADLSSITGMNETFTEGFSFIYNGDNSYVDRIVPSGGFSILKNDNPEYTTAIAYENIDLGYRTIGASHNLGGLEGNDFDDYIFSIIEYFNNGSNVNPECIGGDINSDGDIDVTDIVRLVNIIINSGNPALDEELCAADINQDTMVNVQDVVIITNMILSNDRLDVKSRINPISQAEVSIENNSLYFVSEGSIRGLQFVIDSKDNLLINDNINMDVSYNVIDNKHYILIYSMDGEVLDSSRYKIFESSGIFNIDEIIAVNSNNESVNIFINEEVYPDEFLLKQNFPNPFNPVTNIEIDLSSSENIKLIVFDLNGRQVRELASGYFNKGIHSFVWNSLDDNGIEVSSGIYIYQLITFDQVYSKKMLLLK